MIAKSLELPSPRSRGGGRLCTRRAFGAASVLTACALALVGGCKAAPAVFPATAQAVDDRDLDPQLQLLGDERPSLIDPTSQPQFVTLSLDECLERTLRNCFSTHGEKYGFWVTRVPDSAELLDRLTEQPAKFLVPVADGLTDRDEARVYQYLQQRVALLDRTYWGLVRSYAALHVLAQEQQRVLDLEPAGVMIDDPRLLAIVRLQRQVLNGTTALGGSGFGEATAAAGPAVAEIAMILKGASGFEGLLAQENQLRRLVGFTTRDCYWLLPGDAPVSPGRLCDVEQDARWALVIDPEVRFKQAAVYEARDALQQFRDLPIHKRATAPGRMLDQQWRMRRSELADAERTLVSKIGLALERVRLAEATLAEADQRLRAMESQGATASLTSAQWSVISAQCDLRLAYVEYAEQASLILPWHGIVFETKRTQDGLVECEN